MSHHLENRHLKAEAEYFADLDSRLYKYHGVAGTEADGSVQWQPREAYRVPVFLHKTATPAQVTELNQLLEELWLVNQRFVGEKLREVWAYYAVTGEHQELEHAFLTWCDGYMGRRADPKRVSPRVGNCAFMLAEQLVKEWLTIFGKLYRGEDSVSPGFLSVPLRYTHWLLYDRLWKHLAVPLDAEFVRVERRCKHPNEFRHMEARINMGGWLNNELVPFFRAVKAWAPPVRLAELNALSHDVLRARIRGFASDVHEMRPVLIRNFHPQRTVTELTAECAVAWQWRQGIGIAGLITGRSAGEVLKHIEIVSTHWKIRVGYDGLLFDFRMPWYTPSDLPVTDGTKPLALNYLIVEHFHDRLYSFYDKIDLKRLHQAPAPSAEAPPDSIAEFDADDEGVAIACRTLAESPGALEDEEDAVGKSCRRIPVLRLQRVLRLFENRLGCEVGRGKGSEVNIFRPGGKIYTLGRHTRNREVHPLAVRRMLKVLGIPVYDFHAAVFG